MRKIMVGVAFALIGLTLYIMAHVAAVQAMPSISSWPTDKGRFWEALRATHGLAPTYWGVILLTAGILMLLWGAFGSETINGINRLKVRLEEQRKAFDAANAESEE